MSTTVPAGRLPDLSISWLFVAKKRMLWRFAALSKAVREGVEERDVAHMMNLLRKYEFSTEFGTEGMITHVNLGL